MPKSHIGKEQDRLELTNEKWVLNYVRKKGQDHCFLIIEKLEDDQHKVFEAHLGYADNLQGGIDQRKAIINYFETFPDRIKKLAGENCYYKNWHITPKEFDFLLEKIMQDKVLGEKGHLFYNKFSSLKGQCFFGNSLEKIGASYLRQKSLEITDQFREKGSTLGDTFDKTLKNGYSCVSWALATILTVKPEYEEDIDFMSEFIVVIPQVELPDEKETFISKYCLVM